MIVMTVGYALLVSQRVVTRMLRNMRWAVL